jgi:hypothetical protein
VPLNRYNQGLTIGGTIISADPRRQLFSVQARSGDTFEAIVGRETNYQVLSNLDSVDRNRVRPTRRASPATTTILFSISPRYRLVGHFAV